MQCLRFLLALAFWGSGVLLCPDPKVGAAELSAGLAEAIIEDGIAAYHLSCAQPHCLLLPPIGTVPTPQHSLMNMLRSTPWGPSLRQPHTQAMGTAGTVPLGKTDVLPDW